MSPHLFGYDLQLRKFPYLSDGPRSITPFILAVECLLASERITELYPFHSPLADAVLQMMVTSPAESWQTFQGSRKDRDEQICSVGDALRRETAEDALDWDPELGIGPEEIIGVCALSSFMSERDHAKTISVHAFSWAKGWANVSHRACHRMLFVRILMTVYEGSFHDVCGGYRIGNCIETSNKS